MVELPKGVQRIVSRGREYYYWAPGRGTKNAEKPAPLPSDPTSPEFWTALRKAQGNSGAAVVTVNDVIDLYLGHKKFLDLAPGSKTQYRRALNILRAGFGSWESAKLRSHHIREVVEGMADTPGAANNLLGATAALSAWGIARNHFQQSLTLGVEAYKSDGGHKPWSEEQVEAGERHLTGMVRRGFFLLHYTGQRGSDVVRLGETFIDEGGFSLGQRKTGREVWVPIDDRLAAEMASWERAPGPYLCDAHGPYSRQRLDRHFAEQRANIPALKGCTLHGLRATRVVELRMAGLTPLQIEDQVGMSPEMIQRYCRFADKKRSGKASVVALRERRKNAD